MSDRQPLVPGLADALLAAVESARLGVVVTRLKPEIRNVYVSASAAAMLGRSVEELLAKPPIELLAPDSRQASLDRMQGRMRGDDTDSLVEIAVERPDGSTLPLEAGVALTEIDGAPAAVVFLRDLSERRASAEREQRSNARLSALFEAAPDAIVISRRGVISYANPAAARLLGHDDASKLVETRLDSFVHPDDVEVMVARMASLRPGGVPLGPHEYRARAKDGRPLVVDVTSIAFEDEQGLAIVGFARDVTEARRLQAQLVRADRLAALGTMAAGVAHEINNPLAFMLLGLDAVERRLGSDRMDVESMRATIGDVRHGVARIATIVRQLRTFSRADSVRPRSAVDLRAVLEAAAKMASTEVRQYGRLEIDVPEGLPAVRGDETQLEQVFLNLLLNAAHALRRSDGRVWLSAHASADVVEVVVRDDGKGIAAAEQSRIFDPFFTTKPVGLGTGLGLAIVHSIVTDLGGEILVESEPDKGSTFRVRLPVLDRTPKRSTRPPAAPERFGRRLRILVADDEPAFLRAMRELLEEEHHVLVVGDATEAFEVLAAEPELDLVILDVMMAGEGGMELYERLERELPHHAARVVFVTGGTARGDVERFLAQVRRPVLPKPFDSAKVGALLRRYVQ